MARQLRKRDSAAEQQGQEDLALFDEGILGPDHAAANKMMDNRARLDQLDTAEKARLAEALVAFDARRGLYDPDEEQVAIADGAFQDFLEEQLNVVEKSKRSGCFYDCGGDIEPDEPIMQRVVGWVLDPSDKKVRAREATNVFAHEHCVAQVAEGGDPGTKPMF